MGHVRERSIELLRARDFVKVEQYVFHLFLRSQLWSV